MFIRDLKLTFIFYYLYEFYFLSIHPINKSSEFSSHVFTMRRIRLPLPNVATCLLTAPIFLPSDTAN